MSYHIHIGALQRLSGHEHYSTELGAWTVAEALSKTVELCEHCRTIASAFEEGFELGVERAREEFGDGYENQFSIK